MTVKKSEVGFQCASCGKYHETLPMEFGASAPTMYSAMPPEEQKFRCELNDDLCMIDDTHFFIRGCLEVPVLDNDQNFIWGVWASLSAESLKRCHDIWDQEGRETEPPFFGWLSTTLPLYPPTLNLKTSVHTRPVGERPFIELEPTDHPLAIEQREGITMKRVQEIAEQLLH